MNDEGKAIKEEKHLTILAALDRLESEKNRFWLLVERIQGTASETSKTAEPTGVPSLSTFLDSRAAEYINGLTGTFTEIREELERLLF